MKIFFVATPRAENKIRESKLHFYDLISDLGYEHVSSFAKSTSQDFFEEMKKGRDAHKEFYNEMVDSIQKADICLFEASNPSLGVGFLIQRALDYSKPTIVLYYKDNITYFLSGIEDEKLIIKSYDEKNYKKILKEVLESAREKRDKRFNFFLSPKLLQYIDDEAKEHGITKSKLLRDMIVKHMRDKVE